MTEQERAENLERLQGIRAQASEKKEAFKEKSESSGGILNKVMHGLFAFSEALAKSMEDRMERM